MQVTWLDAAEPHRGDLAEVVALLADARLADAPHDLAPTMSSYAGQLRCGWDGDPPQVALVRDDKDVAVAVLEVHLPTWDNTHLGFVSVTVDPAVRRKGFGRDAFAVGVEHVRAAGRTLLCAESLEKGPGVPFLEKMGMQRASRDTWRRQETRHLDWTRLDAEFAAAVGQATRRETISSWRTRSSASNACEPSKARRWRRAGASTAWPLARAAAAGSQDTPSSPWRQNSPGTPGNTTPASSASTAGTAWASC